MLIICGTIDFDPANRDAAFAAMVKMQEATHEEAGCHHYYFSADLVDPGRVHITERWESDEALAAHFAAPHMAEFQAVVAKLGIKGMDVNKHQVSSSGPVR